MTPEDVREPSDTKEAPGGASMLELNAWDDLRPWTDYRKDELLVTDTLDIPVPGSVRWITPSLRLPTDHPQDVFG
jgi:hypothetical protein